MNGSDSDDSRITRPNRRRLLAASAGAIAAGLAGCSELGTGGDSSELTPPDQTALEIYSDSDETMQEAREKYESGIETFQENVTESGRLEGDYLTDWQELRERMLAADALFEKASDGFLQARRAASSETIESVADDGTRWARAHSEVTVLFGDAGAPPEEVVDERQQAITDRTPPLAPAELRNELRD